MKYLYIYITQIILFSIFVLTSYKNEDSLLSIKMVIWAIIIVNFVFSIPYVFMFIIDKLLKINNRFTSELLTFCVSTLIYILFTYYGIGNTNLSKSLEEPPMLIYFVVNIISLLITLFKNRF